MGWLRGTLIAYGLINILGGVMGLVIRKSTMSLIVGGTAGVLLIACGLAAATKPALGFRSAGMISVVLLGFWGYRISTVLAEDKSPMLPILNLALAAVVLVLLVSAHLRATSKSGA